MKTKLILLGVLAMGLFACTSTPKTETFKVNVNLANADGKMVYLQKDGQTLDCCKAGAVLSHSSRTMWM